MYTATVTIIHPTITRDRYGNDVYDYDPGERITVEGVAVQPAEQSEDTSEAREMVTTGWRLFTPAGMDLDLHPEDRVSYSGKLLEVIGEVARWPHPVRAGGVHHVEADLQRITG